MIIKGVKYEFSADLWQYDGPAAWYFVSLPKKLSKEIRKAFQPLEEGWGRLKATAKTGNTEWVTAIWFDTKRNTYLLPVKAEIRKKECLVLGESVKLVLWI